MQMTLNTVPTIRLHTYRQQAHQPHIIIIIIIINLLTIYT